MTQVWRDEPRDPFDLLKCCGCRCHDVLLEDPRTEVVIGRMRTYVRRVDPMARVVACELCDADHYRATGFMEAARESFRARLRSNRISKYLRG